MNTASSYFMADPIMRCVIILDRAGECAAAPLKKPLDSHLWLRGDALLPQSGDLPICLALCFTLTLPFSFTISEELGTT